MSRYLPQILCDHRFSDLLKDALSRLNTHSQSDFEVLAGEALYGLEQMQKPVSLLPKGAKILEVGSGPGILTAMLKDAFPDKHFSGIEPISGGFYRFRDFLFEMQTTGYDLVESSYEDYYTASRFDLIFLINVLEHLSDWRLFLVWAYKHLKLGGTLVVLCPNYSFPYESHFQLPIVWNKTLTFQMFKTSIQKTESDLNAAGLWTSLNFVKKYQVLKFVQKTKELNFRTYDDLTVLDVMLARASSEPTFIARHRFLYFISRILRHIDIAYFLKKFPRYSPYMKLIMIKTAQ